MAFRLPKLAVATVLMMLAVGCAPAASSPTPAKPAEAAKPTAASAASKAADAKPAAAGKVAYIEAGQVTVGNYPIAHHTAFQKMIGKYGFEPTVVEKLDYSKAPEVIRNLAAQGHVAVIVNSGGYAAALEEVAPEFPNVWFISTSDIKDPAGTKNIAGFVPQWDELGYLTGTFVGLATQSKKVGIVTGQPILSLNRVIGALIDGTKSVNPDARVEVRYTQSFVDNAKSKEATLALAAEGADIIVPYVGSAEPGVIEAVREKSLKMVGYFVDLHEQAPGFVVTSQLVKTDVMYDMVGDLLSSKKLEPKIYSMNVASGAIDLAPARGLVPAEVEKKALEVRDRIKSGQLQVQQNPYKP